MSDASKIAREILLEEEPVKIRELRKLVSDLEWTIKAANMGPQYISKKEVRKLLKQSEKVAKLIEGEIVKEAKEI